MARALVTHVNLKGHLSGWEVAKRFREINPACPVIYMTGAASGQWASHSVPNSILLEKPFAPAQLVTAISNLLNAAKRTAPAPWRLWAGTVQARLPGGEPPDYAKNSIASKVPGSRPRN
jgi:DNA-binding NtrC family response regulator